MYPLILDMARTDVLLDPSNCGPDVRPMLQVMGPHTLAVNNLTTSIHVGSVATLPSDALSTGTTLALDQGSVVTLGTVADSAAALRYEIAGASSLDIEADPAALAQHAPIAIDFLDDTPSAFTFTPIGDHQSTGSHPVRFNVTGMQPGQRLEVDGQEISGFTYNPETLVGTLQYGSATSTHVLFDIHAIDRDLGAAIGEDPEGYFSLAETAMPVCFLKGTRIDTPNGDVAIETLQAGDVVNGRNGPRTVKWMGWRTTWSHTIAEQARAKHLPIRICRNAIADHVPARDICVSPGHHILVDDMLVRAMDIVNGTTIYQETFHRRFEYWHVELDLFDVIFAHGIYSESWADGGNRDYFQNVDITSLRACDTERRQAERPGFMALRQGAALSRLQVKLGKRAERLAAPTRHTSLNRAARM